VGKGLVGVILSRSEVKVSARKEKALSKEKGSLLFSSGGIPSTLERGGRCQKGIDPRGDFMRGKGEESPFTEGNRKNLSSHQEVRPSEVPRKDFNRGMARRVCVEKEVYPRGEGGFPYGERACLG